MLKTVWIQAYFQRKRMWEEYEVPTGKTIKGFLGGVKPVMATKKRWIELDEYSDARIDGARLTRDIEAALNHLDSADFDVVNMTPVTSGRYGWTEYCSAGNGGASSCASWGFGVTEGVMVTARKRLRQTDRQPS